MTRPISDLGVPVTQLQQQIRALVTRQNEQRADASADRLRNFLAPTTPNTTPEEGR